MQNIVPRQIDGDFRVDSRELAEVLGNKHKSVMELIGKNEAHFAEMGHLPFQTETVKNSVGAVNLARYALLNEDQSYFLLTLVRNSKKVTALKAALVMSFRAARNALATAAPALDMSDPLAVAQAFVTAEKGRRLLEGVVKEQAPKVEAFDTFMNSEALLSIQNAGQLIGMGEQKLFRFLRDERVLMDGERAGRDMHNTPYRRYLDAGYFEVKRNVMTLNSGRVIETNTTYVTPKGMEFLRKLTGVKPSNRPLPLLTGATA